MKQKRRTLWMVLFCSMLLLATFRPLTLRAQDEPAQSETPTAEEPEQAPDAVSVEPTAQDEQIEERLTRILHATEWFVDPTVEVRDGVVFLNGSTRNEERREWAGNLARNTQDVVAVVNRITIIPRSIWDFSPARNELLTLWRGAIQAVPLIVFGAVVLFLTWWLARFVAYLTRRLLMRRVASPLLVAYTARAIAIPVFLIGVYLVLQVAGLTRLALTVLGGTGVVGIVVGFAFRDIAENFLASLLLSIRQPFRRNDLIKVEEHTGVVQQMNTRSTILMTLEGNHVQIPNATIFKSTITNFTSNPNRRAEFTVGIGYENSISQAQELIARLLFEHPTVLKTPEPLVLVDKLGSATVDLRIYFWYDAAQHAPFKIKSSLLRLVKRTLEEAGISMPDEAREIIFPRGVPIVQASPVSKPQEAEKPVKAADGQQPTRPAPELVTPEPVTTEAEGHLVSGEHELREQAEQARIPEEGEDLLAGEAK